jgi:CubicO group peptidase (beta-lactamase class C family)
MTPRLARLAVSISAAFVLFGPLGSLAGQTGRALEPTSDARMAARTDSLFGPRVAGGAPGCAVGVVRDDRLVFERGYGSANLDYGVALDGRSSFYLASVSKQFIGAAIGLLALDGRVDLDADVRTYVPEFPDYGTPVTVRHLIHHTSGVRDYLTLFSIAGRSFQDFFDNADAVELIVRQHALNFEPGSEHLYSNSGYVLLAEIIERVTGGSLDAFSQRELFGPLGMYDTHWGEDVGRIVPGRAISYMRDQGDGFRRFLWNFHGKGDGNLHSTVRDLARWTAMFGRTDEPWASLADLMHNRGRLNDGDELDYAFGLAHGMHRDRPTVAHGGGMLGYRTVTVRYPDDGFAAVALCNGGWINPGEWARRLVDIWLFDGPIEGAPAEAGGGPAAPASAPSDAPAPGARDLAAYAGEYHSDELDVTWVLAAEDGALVHEPARGDVVRLRPTEIADVFRGPEGAVLTFAHSGDLVTSFTLDAGRVRGLTFRRR